MYRKSGGVTMIEIGRALSETITYFLVDNIVCRRGCFELVSQ